jgi:hypothetical protein
MTLGPEPVVAPGYQAALFPPPRAARLRWRAVRPDGTRLPPVAQLGVVIAQARTIAAAEGAAWIVGTDHHTVEIDRTPDGEATACVGPDAPSWTTTVHSVLARTGRRDR